MPGQVSDFGVRWQQKRANAPAVQPVKEAPSALVPPRHAHVCICMAKGSAPESGVTPVLSLKLLSQRQAGRGAKPSVSMASADRF